LQDRVAELKVENNHLPMERYIFEFAPSIGPGQSTGWRYLRGGKLDL
jgi:hypothetical protein